MNDTKNQQGKQDHHTQQNQEPKKQNPNGPQNGQNDPKYRQEQKKECDREPTR